MPKPLRIAEDAVERRMERAAPDGYTNFVNQVHAGPHAPLGWVQSQFSEAATKWLRCVAIAILVRDPVSVAVDRA